MNTAFWTCVSVTGATLLTVTTTPFDVPALPLASSASAVSVTAPFATVVVSHWIE